MGLLDRLLGRKTDDRDDVRPLWHHVVAIARHRHWYAEDGVPDTLEGRFDMITAVLALVLLRMESEDALIPPSVRLTELFVEDMDGQLREIGVGDLVVGKHMGRLMSVLGGRLGAFREALASSDVAQFEQAVVRNVTLAGDDETRPAQAASVARHLVALATQLRALSATDVLAARFGKDS